MDTLTFIDELVGLLAWPAAVVAGAWAARGPLLALAGRHRRPPAAPCGTGEGDASPLDVAYGLQTLHSGSKAPGTNGRSVEAFCVNLGVAAGSKAVDEADKRLLLDDTTREPLDQGRGAYRRQKAARDEAADDCLGEYGSTNLGLVGLVAGLLAFL